ncbi:MAG: glycoside hydrolase family 2 protein [candidate division KSB1 bacterium]|nr:glycoside hydrolase family 2 protein [candidate division KSB1 bacterium]MDZ7303977.1 glycoside hydrolase family 2 protein [candidate division KSB1 bacterium]MDZ7313677.1 glycoside hydrolase family 2 protein [candidate division KSB1 bacterium]
MLTIDLNDDWRFQPDWQSPQIKQLPDGLFMENEWLPASVPGTVHTDLLAAGKIPDPFYRDNEWRVQWVAEMGWRYRRSFHVPEEFLNNDAIHLVANGLDTFATIFLNGQRVAETANMFIPHRFEVKSLLRSGENELEIRFDSPLQRAQELEARHGKLPVALESYRVYARKAQYSFSWDWGPKLATSGIWRPIRLEAYHHLRIDDLFAEVNLDKDLQHAHISAKIEVEKFSHATAEFFVEISGPDFRDSKSISSGEKIFSVEFNLTKPRLWWPNGFGAQPLYELKVTARVEDEIVDERATRFGIRQLALRREKDAAGESFVFCVNHVPVFCKGANWIPADSFVPRISNEKYRALLTMAREAHINMLRVWGGGIYEQKIFYDLCDELGILIWQDFMFACGAYPEYPEFGDNVRHEVVTIVKQLRNHPCMVLWCGNNENEWLWNLDTHRPYREMPGIALFEKIIPEVCARYDPTRPYWQSSPFGGEDPNDAAQGDRHQWNTWSNWRDFTEIRHDTGRFLSEFGFQAPAHWETMNEVTAPEDRWPQSKIMEHHNKQVEGTERLFRFLAAHYRVTNDYEDFIYQCQLFQAEALKFSVEHWRRRKFLTAGTLYWQLNDCWPVTSWSAIDYRLRPKAAYYYTKRFFAPVLLSLVEQDGKIEVWITNDQRSGGEGKVMIVAEDFEGQTLFKDEKSVSFSPNASQCCWTVTREQLGIAMPERQYMRAVLIANGEVVSENALFFERFKHLELSDPGLHWELQATTTAGHYVLELSTECLAKSICIRFIGIETIISDNFFDMWPKTSRRIEVTSSQPLQEPLKALKIRTLEK